MHSQTRQTPTQDTKERRLGNKQVRQSNFAKFVNCTKKHVQKAMLVVLLVPVITITSSVSVSAGTQSSVNTDLTALNDLLDEELSQDSTPELSLEDFKKTTEEPIDLRTLASYYTVTKSNLELQDSVLSKKYDKLKSKIKKLHKFKKKLKKLYTPVKEAKVCSKANKFNNSLQEVYTQKEDIVSKIDELYAQYKEEYNELSKNVADFNDRFFPEDSDTDSITNREFLLSLLVQDFSEYTITAPSIDDVTDKYNESLEEEKDIDAIATKSQKIADDFFNLVYYDMLHIGFAEAGCDWFPPEYICYVLNVIENRVESRLYANTVHDVIFANGQYAATWDGNFYKEPSELAKERVTNYLRGRFETGMPSNVVYQAGFRQGDGVWDDKDGIYLCYRNDA